MHFLQHQHVIQLGQLGHERLPFLSKCLIVTYSEIYVAAYEARDAAGLLRHDIQKDLATLSALLSWTFMKR